MRDLSFWPGDIEDSIAELERESRERMAQVNRSDAQLLRDDLRLVVVDFNDAAQRLSAARVK